MGILQTTNIQKDKSSGKLINKTLLETRSEKKKYTRKKLQRN